MVNLHEQAQEVLSRIRPQCEEMTPVYRHIEDALETGDEEMIRAALREFDKLETVVIHRSRMDFQASSDDVAPPSQEG